MVIVLCTFIEFLMIFAFKKSFSSNKRAGVGFMGKSCKWWPNN